MWCVKCKKKSEATIWAKSWQDLEWTHKENIKMNFKRGDVICMFEESVEQLWDSAYLQNLHCGNRRMGTDRGNRTWNQQLPTEMTTWCCSVCTLFLSNMLIPQSDCRKKRRNIQQMLWPQSSSVLLGCIWQHPLVCSGNLSPTTPRSQHTIPWSPNCMWWGGNRTW